MSFQAYLDTIEAKTGKTPNELLALAEREGLGPDDKAQDVIAWLKRDFGLGRGHAMAVVHILKHGDRISDTHVGSTGVHRDESAVLRLDGRRH